MGPPQYLQIYKWAAMLQTLGKAAIEYLSNLNRKLLQLGLDSFPLVLILNCIDTLVSYPYHILTYHAYAIYILCFLNHIWTVSSVHHVTLLWSICTSLDHVQLFLTYHNKLPLHLKWALKCRISIGADQDGLECFGGESPNPCNPRLCQPWALDRFACWTGLRGVQALET